MITMNNKGLILLAYCCSILLIEESLQLSSKCTEIKEILKDYSCEKLLEIKTEQPMDGESSSEQKLLSDIRSCIDPIIESRSKVDRAAARVYHRLSEQYCGDVSGGKKVIKECDICLKKAFTDIYNQHDCLVYNKYRIPEVKQCFSKYKNDKFAWAQAIISGKEEVVDLTAGEYRTCGSLLRSAITNDSKLTFPVSVPLQADAHDSYFNLFLPLFLNAINTMNSTTRRVTCQDIQDSKILSHYEELSNIKINPVPYQVQSSFRELRSSMCSSASSYTTCMNCFAQADEKFILYMFNRNFKMSSLKKDVKYIANSMTKCMNNNFERTYYSLRSIEGDYKRNWPTNFPGCGDSSSISSLYALRENDDPIKVTEAAEDFIKAVAVNYFAFQSYQEILSNCDTVRNSRILCAAKQTKLAIYSISTLQDQNNEEKQLELLSYNLQLCGGSYTP